MPVSSHTCSLLGLVLARLLALQLGDELRTVARDGHLSKQLFRGSEEISIASSSQPCSYILIQS